MPSQQTATAAGTLARKDLSWPPTSHQVTSMNLCYHYQCINTSLGCIFHIRVLMRTLRLQSQCVCRQFCQDVEDFHLQNGANDHCNWQRPQISISLSPECWFPSNTLTRSSCLAQSTQLSSAVQAISPNPMWLGVKKNKTNKKNPSAMESPVETWPKWKSIYQSKFSFNSSFFH